MKNEKLLLNTLLIAVLSFPVVLHSAIGFVVKTFGGCDYFSLIVHEVCTFLNGTVAMTLTKETRFTGTSAHTVLRTSIIPTKIEKDESGLEIFLSL